MEATGLFDEDIQLYLYVRGDAINITAAVRSYLQNNRIPTLGSSLPTKYADIAMAIGHSPASELELSR
jgi:hypothetical protein